jgi:hypothetical protein
MKVYMKIKKIKEKTYNTLSKMRQEDDIYLLILIYMAHCVAQPRLKGGSAQSTDNYKRT